MQNQSEVISIYKMYRLRIFPILDRMLKKMNAGMDDEKKNQLIDIILSYLDNTQIMSQSDSSLRMQIQTIFETESAKKLLQTCGIKQPQKRSNYDARHKETLRVSLEDFFDLFYPDLASRMRFHTARFMDKELIALFGEQEDAVQLKVADALIMIEIVIDDDQDPDVIMIHWESQGQKQMNFPERMYHLSCGIYYQFRKVVFPIAMFTDSAKWDEQISSTHHISLMNYKITDFSYQLIKLKSVKSSEFEKKAPDNPLTWAYLPLTDYPTEERVAIKAKAYSGIATKSSSEKQKAVLLSLIDHTLPLTKDEDQQYLELLKKNPELKEDKMIETIEDYLTIEKERVREEAREEGLEEGLEKGLEKGREEAISSLMTSLLKTNLIDTEKLITAVSDKHVKNILGDFLHNITAEERLVSQGAGATKNE